MSRRVVTTDRRLFLKGSAGGILGLPFLPSLATPAFGADPLPGSRRRFVAFMTDHGGVKVENMFPAARLLTDKSTILAGHDAAFGKLEATQQGNDAFLSPVLRAPAAELTAALVAKMNVLRGLDIPFYIAHNTGGHLGNFARNDGNGSPGKFVQQFPMATIDQVMAWAPSFYGADELRAIRERVMVTGTRNGYSWTYSNSGARTGAQEARRIDDPGALFSAVFGAAMPTTPAPEARKPIVDRVLENYRRLRNGSRRLSAGDRTRLDEHMDRIAELERKLGTTTVSSCKDRKAPTGNFGDPLVRIRAWNDVIAAAFMCGASRVAAVSLAQPLVPSPGSWHQNTAHNWAEAGAQSRLVAHNQLVFQTALVDLARKLNVDAGLGKTYLDDTLIAWTQESGFNTHEACGIPVVTFGGAGGALKTGLFVDYRNPRPASRRTLEGGMPEQTGLTFNRYLGTVLSAVGVPRTEYEKPGQPGYGHPHIDGAYQGKYVAGVAETAGEGLPILKA